jgi:hypothetical protein
MEMNSFNGGEVMMFQLRIIAILALSSVFPIRAATEISLTGTVKDGSGAAISGAAVSLASNASLKATTSATGEFTLTNKSTPSGNRVEIGPSQAINSLAIQGNQLRFSVASPAEKGDVSIFSSSGQLSSVFHLGTMKAGVHLVSLPQLAAGVHILRVTIDGATTSWELICAGNAILMNSKASIVASGSRILLRAAAASVDTLVVKKDGFEMTKQAISSYKQTGIAVVMGSGPVYYYGATEENTCADCKVPTLPDASGLTAKNSKLPDPFKKIDGTQIKKKSEWRCRRQEILAQAMKYIYGDKPAPPEVVSGTVTNSKITVHVEDKGKKIDFSATINLPKTGQAPYPAIISFGSMSSIPSKISSLGVATINYVYSQVATPGTDKQIDRTKVFKGPFYDMYGGNAGNLIAWAWGASRIIDVLQKSGGDIIDYRRLAVTGCSREGKNAFAIGLFDERIALTIPEESSLGGMVAYRVADAKCLEKTQSNFNEQIWLGNNFKQFVNNTSLLPIDAHSLIATLAPRGFYGMENSSANQTAQQMCPQGGNMATQGAAEVYKALGCIQNISYNSTPTDINHCSYSEKYTQSLTENVKKFLLHQPGETGKIEAGTTVPRADWIDWTTPTLENDTKIYDTK